MDQQPPVQPDQNTQPVQPLPGQPQPAGQPYPITQSDPGHGLGIASLITSLLGIWPVGLVLGFMGRSKSKSVGKSNGLALAGLIISAIGAVLSLIWFVFIVIILILGANASTKTSSSLQSSVESASENTSPVNQQLAAGIDAVNGKCLYRSDLTSVADKVAIMDGERNSYNAEVIFFKPDSTDVENVIDAPDPIGDETMVAFNRFKDRDFRVIITGQVNNAGNTSAGFALADARAKKVHDELVALGIPASRLTISDSRDSVNQMFVQDSDLNRNVFVDFKLDCK